MKYKYLDDVKITGGFYKGHGGIIIDYANESSGLIYYDIEINTICNNHSKPIAKRVNENNLRRR